MGHLKALLMFRVTSDTCAYNRVSVVMDGDLLQCLHSPSLFLGYLKYAV